MARLTDDVGESARSGCGPVCRGRTQRRAVPGGQPNLTLPATVGDAAIRDRLAAFGFNVVVVDDNLSQESDAFGRKLVVNSSSVDSGQIAAKFRNVTIPVVSWEQANQDDFGMTGDTAADHGNLTNQTQIAILDHPLALAAGFKAGPVTVTTGPADLGWGLPNANATRLATVVGNPNQVVIYAYPPAPKCSTTSCPGAPHLS